PWSCPPAVPAENPRRTELPMNRAITRVQIYAYVTSPWMESNRRPDVRERTKGSSTGVHARRAVENPGQSPHFRYFRQTAPGIAVTVPGFPGFLTGFYRTTTVFTFTNSRIPQALSSRPYPDALTPPKGRRAS